MINSACNNFTIRKSRPSFKTTAAFHIVDSGNSQYKISRKDWVFYELCLRLVELQLNMFSLEEWVPVSYHNLITSRYPIFWFVTLYRCRLHSCCCALCPVTFIYYTHIGLQLTQSAGVEKMWFVLWGCKSFQSGPKLWIFYTSDLRLCVRWTVRTYLTLPMSCFYAVLYYIWHFCVWTQQSVSPR